MHDHWGQTNARILDFPSRRLSITLHYCYLLSKTSMEADSEPCQTSKIEVFALIVNSF